MATPRHRTAAGSSYFVTTKCWQGRFIFQVQEIADILLRTIFDYRERKAYLLHEFVVMPDHLHLLLTPSPTNSLEKCVQLIKGGSSHQIHKERDHKLEIWQEGFYDWTIRDSNDWRNKVEYIRENPVRAGLVERREDWPYSSAAGQFRLDLMPSKYLQTASGAKAPFVATLTPGLKPRPPKEEAVSGPEGPTPGASANKSAASGAKALSVAVQTPGLKPRPPKEETVFGVEGPSPEASTKSLAGRSTAQAEAADIVEAGSLSASAVIGKPQ